jgi:hypothetical protein
VHELYAAAIDEFRATCLAHGCTPILVFRPTPTATGGIEAERERAFFVRLQKMADDTGITLLNLSPAFQNSVPTGLTVSVMDDHTSALGHRLLAKEFYRQIVELESQLQDGPTSGN